MKRVLAFATVMLVAACFATTAFAGDKADRKTSAVESTKSEKQLAKEAKRKTRAERREARLATTSALSVSGDELTANLEKIESELKWHDDYESGIKAAEKTGKPLFLLNVLGDRCGHV